MFNLKKTAEIRAINIATALHNNKPVELTHQAQLPLDNVSAIGGGEKK